MAATDSPRVSSDALASLEERILRAVQLVGNCVRRRKLLRRRLLSFAPKISSSPKKLESLRADRGEVKARIERLLSQLDNLSD